MVLIAGIGVGDPCLPFSPPLQAVQAGDINTLIHQSAIYVTLARKNFSDDSGPTSKSDIQEASTRVTNC